MGVIGQAIGSGLQSSRASALQGTRSHPSSSTKAASTSLHGTRRQIYRATGRSQSLRTARTVGVYRLLILDGHESHLN
ncbi:hypothetical protein M501DRAFT_1020571 [Patellaria atrata CBS 101060]|uniref:Uncharacterized protein n=1 Tax=Patellaria atrata CBS 101060 TaxID=1346257 RepID=A0A9P4S496_9PEZI|nr:hypothetical protein M501DRAFT_1020571 [Patellaria atrata CBS 101060]